MKKIIRLSIYTVLAVAICVLAIKQLQKNKATNAETANLANIRAEFYPVKTITAHASVFESNMTTTGFLESETDLVVLSETQGTVTHKYKDKGDFVKKGEVIATVDDELVSAQFAAAKASYEQLQKEVERFTSLYQDNAVTSQKVEEMQLNMESAKANYTSSKRQLENTKIKAPVTGFIEQNFIELGQFIGGGTQVCNIIDITNLKIRITVSEHEYKSLRMGQNAIVGSSIYPQRSFTGKLTYIGQKAGYGNTFNVEVKVENADNLLRAGMFVTVSFNQKEKNPSIYIPRRAINGSLKDAFVFVVEGDIVQQRKITTGNLNDTMVEVVGGLSENDRVVTEGNYNLFDGAKVKVMDEKNLTNATK